MSTWVINLRHQYRNVRRKDVGSVLGNGLATKVQTFVIGEPPVLAFGSH